MADTHTFHVSLVTPSTWCSTPRRGQRSCRPTTASSACWPEELDRDAARRFLEEALALPTTGEASQTAKARTVASAPRMLGPS